MKIVAIILTLISVFLGLKHGWEGLRSADHPESLKMMADLGINRTYVPFIGAFTILISVLILFPKTFFLGNLLNALLIVTIMALAINAGNLRMALMEIPFLALPLILIGLKYPFKFQ